LRMFLSGKVMAAAFSRRGSRRQARGLGVAVPHRRVPGTVYFFPQRGRAVQTLAQAERK
jgi:hypothetical protein